MTATARQEIENRIYAAMNSTDGHGLTLRAATLKVAAETRQMTLLAGHSADVAAKATHLVIKVGAHLAGDAIRAGILTAEQALAA